MSANISIRKTTRNGFTSSKVAIPGESAATYRALYRSYVAHFHPQNVVESDLVSVMAVARWRLRRVVSIETNYLALEMDSRRKDVERYVENPTRDRAIAWTFSRLSGGSALPLMTRYEAALHRTFNNAHKQLESLRGKPTRQTEKRTRNLDESVEPTPHS